MGPISPNISQAREYDGALAALRSARALAPMEGAYCPPLVYVCTAAGRFGGARCALRDAANPTPYPYPYPYTYTYTYAYAYPNPYLARARARARTRTRADP